MIKLPRKADYWIAAKAPDLYTLLWFWGMVRNEPPEENDANPDGPL